MEKKYGTKRDFGPPSTATSVAVEGGPKSRLGACFFPAAGVQETGQVECDPGTGWKRFFKQYGGNEEFGRHWRIRIFRHVGGKSGNHFPTIENEVEIGGKSKIGQTRKPCKKFRFLQGLCERMGDPPAAPHPCKAQVRSGRGVPLRRKLWVWPILAKHGNHPSPQDDLREISLTYAALAQWKCWLQQAHSPLCTGYRHRDEGPWPWSISTYSRQNYSKIWSSGFCWCFACEFKRQNFGSCRPFLARILKEALQMPPIFWSNIVNLGSHQTRTRLRIGHAVLLILKTTLRGAGRKVSHITASCLEKWQHGWTWALVL